MECEWSVSEVCDECECMNVHICVCACVRMYDVIMCFHKNLVCIYEKVCCNNVFKSEFGVRVCECLMCVHVLMCENVCMCENCAYLRMGVRIWCACVCTNRHTGTMITRPRSASICSLSI